MEMVLDVYKTPYNADIPVVCMDESPKQLIKETRVPIAGKPGSDAKHDYEYERCGVTNIFMANEPFAGKRYVKITEKKIKIDWAHFIKEIADEYYPNAEKIKLVMDNYGHTKPPHYTKHLFPKKLKEYGIDLSLFIHLNTEAG